MYLSWTAFPRLVVEAQCAKEGFDEAAPNDFSPKVPAMVALTAFKGGRTGAKLAHQFGLYPFQIIKCR